MKHPSADGRPSDAKSGKQEQPLDRVKCLLSSVFLDKPNGCAYRLKGATLHFKVFLVRACKNDNGDQDQIRRDDR